MLCFGTQRALVRIMAEIYDRETGAPITVGLQGCKRSNEAIQSATRLARLRGASVLLIDDDGEWIIHPDGDVELNHEVDQIILDDGWYDSLVDACREECLDSDASALELLRRLNWWRWRDDGDGIYTVTSGPYAGSYREDL